MKLNKNKLNEKAQSISRLEIVACLKLIRWQGVSNRCKLLAIKKAGSCFQTLSLTKRDWETEFQSRLKSNHLPEDCDISQDMQWLAKPGHFLLPVSCVEYPENLSALYDSPIGLFVQGDITALALPQIAVVGSRRYTPAGKKIAAQIAIDLVSAGIGVVSGMAIGIDASAHQACCDTGGQTIAVAGSGLDIVYPKQNKFLAQQILANGCIVSEFAPGTPPRKQNFPARNRIISGLSLAVIVVEAAKRSGSLITARLALEQGKDVFAVPGSILSPQSQGCNLLIQQGAMLYSNIDDLLFELQLPLQNIINEKNELSYSCPVLQAISYDETSLDELLLSLNLDFQAISARLVELELDGLIVRGHNGHYTRLSQ